MATVSFRDATHIYPGSEIPAVNNLNLEINDGEFMVLVGPSGCGKSTALRMLAGLETLTSGEIFIGDENVTHTPPKERDVAMVFQNYALYPHMSVADNMGFALKMQKVPKDERDARVRRAAELLGLEDLLSRKPISLSGGQRQRVAMGRAIVRNPQVFLMDEPLSNLDQKLRLQTRAQIAHLQESLGVTTVYVTHDQLEALTLGHRVAVMREGVLQQVDTPLDLYTKPINIFVAEFIGSPAMNLIEVAISENRATIGGYDLQVPRTVLDKASGLTVTVGVRPEHFDLADNGVPFTVTETNLAGADVYLTGTFAGLDAPQIVRVPARNSAKVGDQITLAIDPGDLHVFDPATGARLN